MTRQVRRRAGANKQGTFRGRARPAWLRSLLLQPGRARARYLNMREKKPGLLNSDVYSPYLAAIFCVVLQAGGRGQQGGGGLPLRPHQTAGKTRAPRRACIDRKHQIAGHTDKHTQRASHPDATMPSRQRANSARHVANSRFVELGRRVGCCGGAGCEAVRLPPRDARLQLLQLQRWGEAAQRASIHTRGGTRHQRQVAAHGGSWCGDDVSSFPRAGSAPPSQTQLCPPVDAAFQPATGSGPRGTPHLDRRVARVAGLPIAALLAVLEALKVALPSTELEDDSHNDADELQDRRRSGAGLGVRGVEQMRPPRVAGTAASCCQVASSRQGRRQAAPSRRQQTGGTPQGAPPKVAGAGRCGARAHLQAADHQEVPAPRRHLAADVLLPAGARRAIGCLGL